MDSEYDSTNTSQQDKNVEDILKGKQQKKGINKAFSFGTTNWENSLKFTAGGYEEDGSRVGSEDPERDALIPKDKTDIVGASNFKTFFNIVKSFVGTGILFLPSAFRDGGLIFAPIALAVLAGITLAGMLLLIDCWEKGRGSFGEIAERAYGKPGKYLVDTFLVLAQLSFGCVYMVFIGETFIQVIGKEGEWPLYYAVLLEIPLLTPLVWIRHVYKLSIANFIGTMCIIFGAIYITYYDIYTIATIEEPREVKLTNWKDIALFLGTAIFTFEGIGTVIPIQQSMKNKHMFRPLLTWAIISILLVLVAFGILGYVAFGETVLGPITLNLPEDDIFVKIVLALYTLAVLFSYPLIVFPAVEILSKIVFAEGPVTTSRKWKKNFFRFLIVCLTAGVAIGGGDDFEKFVSLVGGFACTPLGFILPALFHFKLIAETPLQKGWDIFIMVLGLAMGLFATIYSALSWAGVA